MLNESIAASTIDVRSKSEALNQAIIHQVALLCEDIAATRKFYEEVLGARFLAEFNPPGLVFFKFGETRLLLDLNGKPGLVYFRVEDIEDKVASLKELGVEFEAVTELLVGSVVGDGATGGTDVGLRPADVEGSFLVTVGAVELEGLGVVLGVVGEGDDYTITICCID